MAYAQRHVITATTNASGDATVYSPTITGQIVSVQYVKTDFANGVDFAITLEATGQGVWTEANVNSSATRAPTQPTHDQAGAAMLYAAGGSAVGAPIFAAADRVKIVIAQGGDTKVGTFYLTVA